MEKTVVSPKMKPSYRPKIKPRRRKRGPRKLAFEGLIRGFDEEME